MKCFLPKDCTREKWMIYPPNFVRHIIVHAYWFLSRSLAYWFGEHHLTIMVNEDSPSESLPIPPSPIVMPPLENQSIPTSTHWCYRRSLHLAKQCNRLLFPHLLWWIHFSTILRVLVLSLIGQTMSVGLLASAFFLNIHGHLSFLKDAPPPIWGS